jgi:hypothetical protein
MDKVSKFSNADVICAVVIRRSAFVLVRPSALSAAPSVVYDLFSIVSTWARFSVQLCLFLREKKSFS